jgi:hypothetical protein
VPSGLYMEVIQTATRFVPTIGGPTYYLDVVVRNNSHASEPTHSTIYEFTAYASVITP